MSTLAVSQRKNYWSLDIAKFFCAIFVICAHFAAEHGHFPAIIDYSFSVYIIAVPFFFTCSGFLFFKKLNTLKTKAEKTKYFIAYEKRIFVMYGIWSAIYVSYQFTVWLIKDSFTLERFLDWLHKAIVIQTYSTIWFLPALAIGVAITYFLLTKLSKGKMLLVTAVLYMLGMFGYTYKYLIDGTQLAPAYDLYLEVFITTRNGLFNAVPFVFMGYIISIKELPVATKQALISSKTEFIKNLLPCGISFGLMIVECFILKLKFNVTGMDFCIFLVPFTYFFINALLLIDLKENKVWILMRKLSILIFVSQRIFLTVLPPRFPQFFEMLYKNSYIGLIATVGATIIFSIFIILLSKKFKFLNKMY